MNCKKAQELISLHIDNKLSLQEVNELNMHLSSCDKCKQNYDDLKEIRSLISTKNDIKLSSNFTDATMAKIYSEKSNQPKVIHFSFINKYVAMVASFLFVVAVGTYYTIKQPTINISNVIFEPYNQTELDMENIYDGDITSFLM